MKKGSLKAIVVLLCIALISGGLLSVLNDVLFVSEEEITQRSLRGVYAGGTFTGIAETLNTQYSQHSTYGEVLAVHKEASGNVYVLHTQGKQGYPNGAGSVNLWLAINSDAKFVNIIYGANVGQTLMGDFSQKYLTDRFVNKELVGMFTLGSADVNDISVTAVAGATQTSNAIVNAVNMALYYARNALGFGENPEAEAIEKVKALDSKYASYNFAAAPRYTGAPKTQTIGEHEVSIEYVIISSETAEKNDFGFVITVGDMEFAVVANQTSKTISHIALVGEDNITQLQGLNFSQLTAFAGADDTQNAARAAAERALYYTLNSYLAYITTAEAEVNGSQVTYTAKGVSNGDSTPYTLEIVIDDNKIVSITVEIDGATDGYASEIPANLSLLSGKELDEIDGIKIHTGATNESHSSAQVKRIIKYCLTDYLIRMA